MVFLLRVPSHGVRSTELRVNLLLISDLLGMHDIAMVDNAEWAAGLTTRSVTFSTAAQAAICPDHLTASIYTGLASSM